MRYTRGSAESPPGEDEIKPAVWQVVSLASSQLHLPIDRIGVCTPSKVHPDVCTACTSSRPAVPSLVQASTFRLPPNQTQTCISGRVGLPGIRK